MRYFSDNDVGEIPRTQEEIDEVAWGGLRALIQTKINDGSFGMDYPTVCPDGSGPTGTDRNLFEAALRAEVRGLPELLWRDSSSGPPSTLTILDLLIFCWWHIGDPTQEDFHDFFNHYHLSHDFRVGRHGFCEDANRIFARNGIAFTLTMEGAIERLGPPVLRDELENTQFKTGDAELDSLLESARRKFLDPREEIRREALLELWDAWERLKTTGQGANKKDQITSLLNDAAGSSYPNFRKRLETEAVELTSIGNNHQIRHTEVSQEKVEKSEHVDYLFHRLFGLIQLLLKTKTT